MLHFLSADAMQGLLLILFFLSGERALCYANPVKMVPVRCRVGKACVLACYHRDSTVNMSWGFDRWPINWLPRSQYRYSHPRFGKERTFLNEDVLQSGNCTLTINNMTTQDSGRYTCTLTNRSGHVTFLDYNVTVFDLDITALIIIIVTTFVLQMAFAFGAYKRSQGSSQPQQSEQSLPQRSSSAQPPPLSVLGARLVYALLGLVSMSPWRFLSMALLYRQHRLDVPDQSWAPSLIVLLHEVPQLLSLPHSLYCVPSFTHRQHCTGCLVGITLLYLVVFVSVKVATLMELLLAIGVCALCLSSSFSAVLQRHLSEELNSLPKIHRESFARGQEFSGILAPVILVFCAIPKDVDTSVFCFFVIAFVISLAAVVSYCFLPSLVKHYFNQTRQESVELSPELLNANEKKNSDNQGERESPNLKKSIKKGSFVFVVNLVTFIVYPVIVADVHTTNPGVWSPFFNPICCFLNFNVFNLLGQKIPFVTRACKSIPFCVLFPSLLIFHMAFISLLMTSNVHRHFSLPLLINDYIFALIMAMFSFSHGALTHLTMSYRGEEDGDDRPKIFGRALGSVAGVLISFGWK